MVMPFTALGSQDKEVWWIRWATVTVSLDQVGWAYKCSGHPGGILVSEEKCEAHGPTGKPDLPPRASTDAYPTNPEEEPAGREGRGCSTTPVGPAHPEGAGQREGL